ncbi:hypothetical protein RHSIM_Rhsim05G0128600 [Rhododendron simsii]|uniref:Pentatricopeptide repeat-containing protein n=1 Tax=Rhododendron simsii TaxID=118357 RepID=A0A834LPL8_RHOSS|nr:hypothetical protein RHSIM_Rhsim05G0128600 [Rhododendron simsii]
MIGGYRQNHVTEKAMDYMHGMWHQGFEPDEVTHINMLVACVKSGDIEIGRRIIDWMVCPSLSSWNAILSGYSQNENHNEAIKLFREMQFRGVQPDCTTLAIIVSSCAGMGPSGGRKTDALENTVTWNEMIHGYAQNGRNEEAVSVYKDMIVSGEEPNGITFVVVLTACSHSGLVDTGIEIFNSMKLEHSVDQLLDHNTCIIDALGHAGRFHEAEVLIDRMPYKDDPTVREVLLSSSNMYSSLGRWEEAKVVRKMMGDKQVLKNPGYSWVESKNRMEVFDADDDIRMVVDKFQAANI